MERIKTRLAGLAVSSPVADDHPMKQSQPLLLTDYGNLLFGKKVPVEHVAGSVDPNIEVFRDFLKRRIAENEQRQTEIGTPGHIREILKTEASELAMILSAFNACFPPHKRPPG